MVISMDENMSKVNTNCKHEADRFQRQMPAPAPLSGRLDDPFGESFRRTFHRQSADEITGHVRGLLLELPLLFLVLLQFHRVGVCSFSCHLLLGPSCEVGQLFFLVFATRNDEPVVERGVVCFVVLSSYSQECGKPLQLK